MGAVTLARSGATGCTSTPCPLVSRAMRRPVATVLPPPQPAVLVFCVCKRVIPGPVAPPLQHRLRGPGSALPCLPQGEAAGMILLCFRPDLRGPSLAWKQWASPLPSGLVVQCSGCGGCAVCRWSRINDRFLAFFLEQKVIFHRPEFLIPKSFFANLAKRAAICIVQFHICDFKRWGLQNAVLVCSAVSWRTASYHGPL